MTRRRRRNIPEETTCSSIEAHVDRIQHARAECWPVKLEGTGHRISGCGNHSKKSSLSSKNTTSS
jgi:hypothetical protein